LCSYLLSCSWDRNRKAGTLRLRTESCQFECDGNSFG
jgi:hypothetical protein